MFFFFFSRHVTDDNRFRRRDNRSPSAGSSGPRYKGEDMVRFPGYASVSPPTVAEKDADLGWLARGGFDRPYRLTSCSPRRLQTYARMTDVGYIRDKVSPSLVFSAHYPAPPPPSLTHTLVSDDERIPTPSTSNAAKVGPGAEVRTIDVKTQKDGPKMTLGEWCEYWSHRTRGTEGGAGARDVAMAESSPPRHANRSLNVVSLSLANSALEEELETPALVRQADLVRLFWSREDEVNRPKAELYGLMSPSGCYTDWHVDFGGSSVWYSLVRGKKYFALAPPTEHNLKCFAAWANSCQQEKVNLLVYLKDPVLYELRAGDTMVIPGGWPHAVYTPCDSVAVGGNFLHPFSLATQLEVWRLEDSIGVPASCRFPRFKQIMWYVARTLGRVGRDRSGSGSSEEGDDDDNGRTTPVLKLRLKPLGSPLQGPQGGLKVKLPASAGDHPRRHAARLLLAHNPGDGLGALASALGGWLRGPQSHWGAPARIARPGQVLGDLETAAGRCVGEGAARAKADYGAARLPEPEFKGLDDCKERVTPLVRRLKVSGTLSPPCGLGATKKVKKSVGVRDRLKKKLGMR